MAAPPASPRDRLAASLAAAGRIHTSPNSATATQAQARAETQQVTEVETRREHELEAAAQSREAAAAAIKQNPFYQAFEANAQLTQEE